MQSVYGLRLRVGCGFIYGYADYASRPCVRDVSALGAQARACGARRARYSGRSCSCGPVACVDVPVESTVSPVVCPSASELCGDSTLGWVC